jgi:parallel beta-helix repeat protein
MKFTVILINDPQPNRNDKMKNLHPGIKKVKSYKSIMIITCFCLFFITANKLTASIYYVSTSGSDSNNGTTEALAWKTISKAATTAVAGDTVYIESGNYGHENIEFDTAGIAANPIIFEGYKTTPGDNPVVNYTLGDALDSSNMPLLDGGNRATAGIALYLRKSYVIVKNIQIKNFQRAVRVCGTNYDIEYCTVENIIAKNLGDTDILYSGFGIEVTGKWNSTTEETISTARYNTVRRCIVVNSAAEGISIVDGDNNIIEDCQVYSTDTETLNEATHYYIILARANNNTVIGCYAYRHPSSKHVGHGIEFKYTCENNLVKDCVSENSSTNFSVRHRGIKYNTFENCIAIGGNGLSIRDGASYNTFKNCLTTGSGNGVWIFDTSEDQDATSIDDGAGHDNTFENCIFKNVTYGINFGNYSNNSTYSAFDNSFINCTFDTADYLFILGRISSGNTLTNCIISNVTNLSTGSASFDYSSSYSNFDVEFTMPTGIGNISADPKFVDAANGDFRLQADSPCIDAGTTVYSYDYTVSPPTSTVALDIDYSYLLRPYNSTYDIGAHEYPDVADPLVYFKCTLNINGLIDEMGNVSSGTIYGADIAAGIEGDNNGALDFNGTSDYVDFGTPSILNQTSTDIGRSISAWIKPDANGTYKTIVAKNIWRYSLFTSSGRLNGYIKGSTSDAHSRSNELMTIGEWQHVAMTFDINGDKKVHLYINGKEVTYYSQTAMVGTPTNASTYKFTIGSDQGNQYFFDGIIDEVKMFDQALSASDVAEEYLIFGIPASVLSVDMNQGSGTVVSDSSIYENNGTMYGNTSIINEGYEIAAGINGTSWVEGISGRGLKFDGIDDYVDFGTPSILNQTTTDIGRSISAWIKPDANGTYKTIVAKNIWRYSLFTSSGRLNGYIKGSTSGAHSRSNELMTIGEWQHVAMTFDINGDKKVHLYINGEEVTYYSQTAMVGNPTDAYTYKFTIGSDQGNQYFFDGVIDEVKMFDEALSADQVDALYQKNSD